MPTADPLQGLSGEEAEALFAPLDHATGVALAVSGGADSLALLVCAGAWRECHRHIPVHVLTVDHRLRGGSAREAEHVCQIAEQFGLPSRILVWEGPTLATGMEAAAREARYRLLVTAAQDIGCSHLALAHHRDDVAETLLMRLQRGSGVFGLAAMRGEIRTDDTVIFRPFLTVSRMRLAATTAAAELSPVHDPMNDDPRFFRSRVRALMPQLGELGLGVENLAATAERLTDAAEAIDDMATELIREAVRVDDMAVATLQPATILAAPPAVRYRLLARLLMAIGGASMPPRFDGLASLLVALDKAEPCKRCLAGAVLDHQGGRTVLYRETGRRGLARMPLAEGARIKWDRRFDISVDGPVPDELSIGQLGEAGRRLIGARGSHLDALAALPAIYKGETVVAVPPLDFFDGPRPPVVMRQMVGERALRPPLFPDF